MPSRHKSRQHALQTLFQLDVRQLSVDEAIKGFYETLRTEAPDRQPEADPFMEELVRGTVAHLKEIDALIQRHSEHWRIERMPVVDRNILRMAVFEMAYMKTPAPVVIDQAVELARKFSGEQAAAFVNGVLDAIRQQLETRKVVLTRSED